jgi:hypothetical protein
MSRSNNDVLEASSLPECCSRQESQIIEEWCTWKFQELMKGQESGKRHSKSVL